jgi:hypothetical protein
MLARLPYLKNKIEKEMGELQLYRRRQRDMIFEN